ncbi:hypothetical protein GF337_08935, partial [candidate division KSB1 bacterium]|nr:hypothetical protein [candidate division KSB1 bacterium]
KTVLLIGLFVLVLSMPCMGRYFDPTIGRWLIPDPLAGKHPSISPYVYCLNNPLKNIDPDGRLVKIAHLKVTVFGLTFKSSGYKNAERAISVLRSTATGEKIYQNLHSRKEVVNVKFGDIKERPAAIVRGIETAGQTSALKAVKENGKLKVTEALVQVDKTVAEQDWNTQGVKTQDAGSAITLGHEFGHTKSMLDDVVKYKEEVMNKTAEDVQAIPIENAVRNELREKEKKENE